jgi:hypothetical protein
MKLKVQFEMPLPEGFEPYLEVIARAHGYQGNGSSEQFICQEVCQPQASALFRSLIVNALTPYFGIAGQSQVAIVEEQYSLSHTVVADIVSD